MASAARTGFCADRAAAGASVRFTTAIFDDCDLVMGFIAGVAFTGRAAIGLLAKNLDFCCVMSVFGMMPSSISALTQALDSFERFVFMHAWHPADPATCFEQYA